MKHLPGMAGAVLLTALLWGMQAEAHGPGRRLQAESWFCEGSTQEKRLHRGGVQVGERQEVCLVLHNTEEQAMEIQFSLLEGEVMAGGVATCLDRAGGGGVGARLEGEGAFRLGPGERVERRFGVVVERMRGHDAEQGELAPFRGWMGCLSVRGTPLPGEGEPSKGHLKGFRTLHMMRLTE